jgi:toxin YoeB
VRYVFLDRGWEDYSYWQSTDKQVLKKLNRLIDDCARSPYAGIGKPELLAGDFSGWWSRRIDGEHRLVYRIEGNDLIIAQCRYHYHK